MYEGVGVPVTFLDPKQKNWQNIVEEAMTKSNDFSGVVRDAQKKVQEKIEEFVKSYKGGL